MKIKTSEATELQLDFLVAKSEGIEVRLDYHSHNFYETIDPRVAEYYNNALEMTVYNPSDYWLHGGPIIEREKISIEHLTGAGDGGVDVWVATCDVQLKIFEKQGNTPLIAAMRCYVASKMGDDIDIPTEIMGR
jgi:hypothetical protein